MAPFFMEPEEKPIEQKPEVFTEDPFSYNFVSLKKSKVDELPTPSASDVMANSLYHAIGQSLGIANPHDWNRLYDKVFIISEWAKERTGLTDPVELMTWIKKTASKIPSLGAKKINNLYAHIRLGIKKGKDVS